MRTCSMSVSVGMGAIHFLRVIEAAAPYETLFSCFPTKKHRKKHPCGCFFDGLFPFPLRQKLGEEGGEGTTDGVADEVGDREGASDKNCK